MSLENVKHIILILSGKGGVGKSSITTQLALSLSLAGSSIGILDIDLTGPSIPRLLGIESAKITQAPGGWLPVEVHPSQILPPLHHVPPRILTDLNPANDNSNGATTSSNGSNAAARENVPNSDGGKIGSLHVMSLGFLLPSRSSAVVWRGPKKTAMVRQFLTSVLWPPNLDYLLIDTPPGTSDEHISLAETLLSTTTTTTSTSTPQLAGAVIVTTPQAVATSDVRKEINFCAKVSIGVLGVIENMSGYVCECCGVATNLFGKGGGEVMSTEFAIRFLGRVPVDARWGALIEEGIRPVYGVVDSERRDANGENLDDEADGERGVDVARDQDLASLVDKYRSCSLCPVFQDITRDLVGIIENAHSVSEI